MYMHVSLLMVGGWLEIVYQNISTHMFDTMHGCCWTLILLLPVKVTFTSKIVSPDHIQSFRYIVRVSCKHGYFTL